MFLKRLTLHNFGTYKGSQTFDLTVSKDRNVILIGGQNGSGKSTFLESLRLCFYGIAAFRGTLSREKYERYLVERIHRDPDIAAPSRAAAVEIEFDHGDQSGIASYHVVREWIRSSHSAINESVTLRRDGELVQDIDAQHWQDFIQELMPLGVSDLFFFDGEKVQLLADDGSDAATLSEAVKNLLGTDIVERLGADLAIYLSRGLQKADTEESAVAEMNSQLAILESLREQRTSVVERNIQAEGECKSVLAELDAMEQSLQKQGGSYARNRGRLEERRKQISARVDALESTLREHSTGLLPIALAPNLLRDVIKQLEIEQDIRFGVVIDESLSRAARLTLTNLKKLDIRTSSKTVKLGSLPEFDEIARVVRRIHEVPEFTGPMVHDLSGEQERQIQSWAAVSLMALPTELSAIGLELEGLYRDRQKVERDLERIPHDDVLKPLLEALQTSRQNFAAKSEALNAAKSSLSQIEEAIVKADGIYKRASDVVMTASSQRAALSRADKAQAALREFRDALVRQKIRAVEHELTVCFAALYRKAQNRTFSIDPGTFVVTLRDEHEHMMSKSELSAGEKQIYAIAVLWALAKVSRRPAPIIIDTPLARLDSEHRKLLIEKYFPVVSHQVIILSTDTEIDQHSFSALHPSISRAYELRFDHAEEATTVAPGYFGEVA